MFDPLRRSVNGTTALTESYLVTLVAITIMAQRKLL